MLVVKIFTGITKFLPGLRAPRGAPTPPLAAPEQPDAAETGGADAHAHGRREEHRALGASEAGTPDVPAPLPRTIIKYWCK